MKSQLIRISAAVALSCTVPLASASVLTFDDLGGLAFFTAPYNGFSFGDNNPATNPWFHTTQSSPFYTPHSGSGYVATDFSLYNNANPYEPTQAITNPSAFIFNGAWFSGADAVGYELYNGSDLVSTSLPSAALSSVPQFVASGYSGLVTGVVVFGRQGFYAMDDFTYNQQVVGAVAEPNILPLVLTALVAAGLFSTRRRHSVPTAPTVSA